jgi:hypothetical protein
LISGRSHEARYAVYLVDPGPTRPAILALIQDIEGVDREAAAEYLRQYPSLISFCDTEAAARSLADRFRELEAVAVVRPADKPLAPAPVEEVDATPVQRGIHVALIVLALIQLAVSAFWFREGQVAGAFFGLLLALYVLVYFGPRLRK